MPHLYTHFTQGRRKRGGWGLGRPTFFDHKLILITNALAACIHRVGHVRCCIVQAVLNYCVCPVKPAAGRSPGYADVTGHTPFSLRARGLTLASQSTRYSVHFRHLIFRPPHPPCPSYGPVHLVSLGLNGHACYMYCFMHY